MINLRFGVRILALQLLLFAAPVQAIPEIQTWDTSNGVPVYFVETKDLPMVDIRLVFDAGSARDADKAGLASLTNGLLVEGAAGMSAQQIAENFESVGAEVSHDSLRDMAIIGIRSLTDKHYFTRALETYVKVVTRPEFPQRAVARDISNMKISVQAGKQSPSTIAEEAFFEALYGDHPYASPSGGTEESLSSLSREDVLDFYKQYYVATNARLNIVGNISRQLATEVAEKITSGLTKGEKPKPLPPVKRLTQPKVIEIDFPSAQTHILVGQTGVKRGDKDYFPLYLANHSFGGSGFASRLVDKIREQHGYAYSVYSYFSPMRQLGPFTMGMQTKNDQSDAALVMLRKELEHFVQEGPTEQELEASVSNVVGSFPLNLDGNSKLLGYISMISFYDLPKDYLDKFVMNINRVTLSEMKRAIRSRLNPDKLVTVVVGKRR